MTYRQTEEELTRAINFKYDIAHKFRTSGNERACQDYLTEARKLEQKRQEIINDNACKIK